MENLFKALFHDFFNNNNNNLFSYYQYHTYVRNADGTIVYNGKKFNNSQEFLQSLNGIENTANQIKEVAELSKELDIAKKEERYEYAGFLSKKIDLVKELEEKIEKAISIEDWKEAKTQQDKLKEIIDSVNEKKNNLLKLDFLLKSKQEYIKNRNFDKLIEIDEQIKQLKDL